MNLLRALYRSMSDATPQPPKLSPDLQASRLVEVSMKTFTITNDENISIECGLGIYLKVGLICLLKSQGYTNFMSRFGVNLLEADMNSASAVDGGTKRDWTTDVLNSSTFGECVIMHDKILRSSIGGDGMVTSRQRAKKKGSAITARQQKQEEVRNSSMTRHRGGHGVRKPKYTSGGFMDLSPSYDNRSAACDMDGKPHRLALKKFRKTITRDQVLTYVLRQKDYRILTSYATTSDRLSGGSRSSRSMFSTMVIDHPLLCYESIPQGRPSDRLFQLLEERYRDITIEEVLFMSHMSTLFASCSGLASLQKHMLSTYENLCNEGRVSRGDDIESLCRHQVKVARLRGQATPRSASPRTSLDGQPSATTPRSGQQARHQDHAQDPQGDTCDRHEWIGDGTSVVFVIRSSEHRFTTEPDVKFMVDPMDEVMAMYIRNYIGTLTDACIHLELLATRSRLLTADMLSRVKRMIVEANDELGTVYRAAASAKSMSAGDVSSPDTATLLGTSQPPSAARHWSV